MKKIHHDSSVLDCFRKGRFKPLTVKKTKILALIYAFCGVMTMAEVQFGGLDLSPTDKLLFKATVTAPGFGSYDTLFEANLKDGTLEQLTFFPEQVTYLQDSNQLQLQNRFGVFRTDSELSNLVSLELFPSFENGQEIGIGKITPIISSPDGKYLIDMKPTSAAFGDLVLFDQTNSRETVVAREVELSFTDPVVLWAPDSKSFVYSTAGKIYYYSIHQYIQNRVLDASYRMIHEGTIRNATWGPTNTLYYITNTLVYRIGSGEFFTKSLYSGLLKVGKIVGKIPFRFDPNFDSFWIAPDGEKILLNKGGRNLFLYYLDTEDFSAKGKIKSLPYLYLPRNTHVRKVLWSSTDTITVLTSSIVKGENKSSVFRLSPSEEESTPSTFAQTSDEEVLDVFLSPLETSVAIVKSDAVLLYNYLSWQKELEIPFPQPIHALWRDEAEIIVTGAYTSQIYDLNRNTSRLLSLSQAGDYGFHHENGNVQMLLNGGRYEKGEEWSRVETMKVNEAAVASPSYRVYLEASQRGMYRNIVMIRNIKGYGTTPLFPPETIEYEAYPQEDEPVSFTQFNHGSRIRGREVALVFNATESIEGLTTILNILSDYSMKATFFVGGEAIRRYPDAVKEIAESGHEVGSLFYTYFNMTDSRFVLNKDFIKQGLARTEDDYFAATGKEVSLLWHAPYYFINSDIIQASREMNYIYVGRDVDAMDWVGEGSSSMAASLYLSSAELVERILERKKPGSIVPLLVGIPDSDRRDFLFQKLDLLINALISRGYRVVPVSELVENTR